MNNRIAAIFAFMSRIKRMSAQGVRSYKVSLIVKLVLSLLSSFTGSLAHTQVLDPNDFILDYYKVLEFKNPKIEERINIYSSIVHGYQKDSLAWNPWGDYLIQPKANKSIEVLPFRSKVSFNSSYPRSYNDGPVWQGRGLTTQAQGGVTGRYGVIRYTFAPIVYWSENKSFDLAQNTDEGLNKFNYQFQARGYIDYVQRFGDESFFDFHPGQSEVRVIFNWFTIGLSTQNVVFGPAQRNPILLGNSGGMMPHLDLGTDRPVRTKIGKIEGKLYWGRMSESDYNNGVSTNPNQYFSALSVGYSPKWIKGLYFGANRVFYKRWENFNFSDYLIAVARFNPPEERVFGNDDLDQTGSFTMRWWYPEVGFEAYMELAKSDFGGNVLRFEPEHGRAVTIGLAKVLELKAGVVKLSYEHTTLGQPKNSIIRQYNRYYSHQVGRNGYTYRGQLLGAGIGPGSNSDWFDAKVYTNKGMFGATMQRIRFDDDYFYANFTQKENRDFEWSWGLQYEKLMSSGRLGIEVNYASRQSLYFIEGNNTGNIYAAFSYVVLL